MVESKLKWCQVSVAEVIENGKRLEASVFGIEVQQALATIHGSKYPNVPLIGENGFVMKAHYGDRLKRNYIPKTASKAIGFLGSSEMLDVNPKPIKFMLNDDTVEKLRLSEGMILLSRSGTIGNTTYVSKTLKKYLVSEHAIRLECREYPGYVYTFLKSKTGKDLILSKNFGSVVQEIEPDDISTIPVPNPSNELKAQIDNLIKESFSLRDKSNELEEQARALLINELDLPDIDTIEKDVFDKKSCIESFNINLNQLELRFDASYHIPLVKAINTLLEEKADKMIPIGDTSISKEVILPGRFKRVYVDEGYGTVFIGGKQLWQLDPVNKKYLSNIHHGDYISEKLQLHKNMSLITCSGTIGKVSLVNEAWEDWAANQHIIRIVPASDDIAGYLYTFLSSDYGNALIKRCTYGAVIDEIDDTHVKSIRIPLLKRKDIQDKINTLVLQANDLRYCAYKKEQSALNIMNTEVLGLVE